jgi:hypothetical protein
MRLARPTVVARVEKGKQSLLLATRSCALLPCFQASIRRFQIILFQDVCLLLVRLCSKYEVFGNYREFIEYEEVRRIGGGYVDDVELLGRVLEGVKVFLWCGRGLLEFR